MKIFRTYRLADYDKKVTIMCKIDITQYILQHNLDKLANQKVIYDIKYGKNVGSLPVRFFSRGEDNDTTIYGSFGYVSDISINFQKGLVYNSDQNMILNFHVLQNNTDYGVMVYKSPIDNFCNNSFLSTGSLTGCIACFLAFENYIVFMHEGGDGTMDKNDGINHQLSGRCQNIWRALCGVLGLNHENNCEYVEDNDSITKEKAIDWLIKKIESLDDLVLGSIMYKSKNNACNQGKSKKITFLNYDPYYDSLLFDAQMICIAQRNYIGFCSMCWEKNNAFKKVYGIKAEVFID